jgi:hypothetical protein
MCSSNVWTEHECNTERRVDVLHQCSPHGKVQVQHSRLHDVVGVVGVHVGVLLCLGKRAGQALQVRHLDAVHQVDACSRTAAQLFRTNDQTHKDGTSDGLPAGPRSAARSAVMTHTASNC